MNRIYRTVWNTRTASYVVAHERAKHHGGPSTTRTLLAGAVAAALLGSAGGVMAEGSECSGSEITIDSYAQDCVIDTPTNSLTITEQGMLYGYYHDALHVTESGSIETLLNDGRIRGYDYFDANSSGIHNAGTITELHNSGEIDGDEHGIINTGVIGEISNTGVIDGRNGIGIVNYEGEIGAIANSGTIRGGAHGIASVNGDIDTLNNLEGGYISGDVAGIIAYGSTINTLHNENEITGDDVGILLGHSSIGLLRNDGGIIGYGMSEPQLAEGFSPQENGGGLLGAGVLLNGDSSISTLENNGDIYSGFGTGVLIQGSGSISTLRNQQFIGGKYAGIVLDGGSIGTLENAGMISSMGGYADDNVGGILVDGGGSIVQLSNTANGYIESKYNAIGVHDGSITTLDNHGFIFGEKYGLFTDRDGSITTLNNHGVIEGGNYEGIGNGGTISTLNNHGEIEGIYNQGNIGTLRNAQGGGAPLQLSENLPDRYEVVVNGESYGRLEWMGGWTGGEPIIDDDFRLESFQPMEGGDIPFDQMAFGIASGSNPNASYSYDGVLLGFHEDNLDSTTGSYGSLWSWVLNDSENNGVWDLSFTREEGSLYEASRRTGNRAGYGAARMIDNDEELLGMFGGLEGDQQLSDGVRQLLPLLSAGSQLATRGAMQSVNRVVQARQRGERGMASGDQVHTDRQMWLKPVGSWGKQHDTKGVDGFKTQTTGLVWGADRQVNAPLRMGAALAYAQADMKSNSSAARQRLEASIVQLIGYGSYALDEQTRLSFQMDTAQIMNKGRRDVALNNSVARSSYDGYSFHLGMGVARDISLDARSTFTPSVRMDYTWLHDEGYQEGGADLANLSVSSRSTDELVVLLDGRLSHQDAAGMTYSANLGLGYDAYNKDTRLTARMAGGDSAAFVTEGLETKPWLARGGLGVSGELSNGMSLAARYDVEHRERYLNQGVSLTLRWAF